MAPEVDPPVAPRPLVVVGAGAAGLLTAIFAAREGVPVLLLETRPKPGAKIRVSGGGRCNVLPSAVSIDDFHTEGSRNAMRNALCSWPLREVRAFFEKELGIALKVEDTGKVFPESDDAREVVRALLDECARTGVELLGDARVTELARLPGERPLFELTLASGERLRAGNVVLATGGLSLPKTGSDGAGFEFARACGHAIVPTYPALVPLSSSDPRWAALAGISLRTSLSVVHEGRVEAEFEGDLLFTHRGFSGPVVLDASHRLTAPWSPGRELRAQWIGTQIVDWDVRLRGGGTQTVGRLLRDVMPRRLVEALLDLAGVPPDRSLSQLSRDERRCVVEVLDACPLSIDGNAGYRAAEVTGGGVPLGQLKTSTLESRLVPGLYFAGEIVDVTGRIGGFNFLWAWVSGRKVGQAVARALAQA